MVPRQRRPVVGVGHVHVEARLRAVDGDHLPPGPARREVDALRQVRPVHEALARALEAQEEARQVRHLDAVLEEDAPALREAEVVRLRVTAGEEHPGVRLLLVHAAEVLVEGEDLEAHALAVRAPAEADQRAAPRVHLGVRGEGVAAHAHERVDGGVAGGGGQAGAEHAAEVVVAQVRQVLRPQARGVRGLVEHEELAGPLEHVGVREVLQLQVEGVRERPPGPGGAERPAVEQLARQLLRAVLRRPHEVPAVAHGAAAELPGGDEAVAVEEVAVADAAAVEAPWPGLVERAPQLRRQLALDLALRPAVLPAGPAGRAPVRVREEAAAEAGGVLQHGVRGPHVAHAGRPPAAARRRGPR
mmetsp:Transcript_120290/g.373926  ORF Transcript_120290/g.373926 Transcript_120290/m.373926 type:complete len:359 (-) Transcript_120290:15-1091(-)